MEPREGQSLCGATEDRLEGLGTGWYDGSRFRPATRRWSRSRRCYARSIFRKPPARPSAADTRAAARAVPAAGARQGGSAALGDRTPGSSRRCGGWWSQRHESLRRRRQRTTHLDEQPRADRARIGQCGKLTSDAAGDCFGLGAHNEHGLARCVLRILERYQLAALACGLGLGLLRFCGHPPSLRLAGRGVAATGLHVLDVRTAPRRPAHSGRH